MRTESGAERTAVQYVLLAVAVLLHLAVGPFYLASGLVAPGWAVLLLWLTWVVLLVLLVLLWRRRPPLAPLVPLGAVVLILAVITAGEQLLGWTG